MPVDVEVMPNSEDVDETEKINPAIKDEKKNADDTELVSDAKMEKENGDAKEIVNGNGIIDSSQGNISEEHQNSCEDHTTHNASTSETTPSETKNIDDQDNNAESKPFETGSNDENTTNIIESINDAMKENDEATYDKNIEIVVNEECSDIQEKDVLIEEIILEDTSIEQVKEHESGNSENNEDISSDKQVNVTFNDVGNSAIGENVLVERKEETTEISEDSKEHNVECLSENNVADSNESKDETVDTSSNSNIPDLQTEEKEEQMEVSGSIELGVEQKEDTPNESKMLEDDKVESFTENNVTDVNGANIKIDDALSISKSSELQTEHKEGSIEIIGSIELEAEQNDDIIKVNNTLEDNKVESLTENNAVNVDEIKNEVEDNLPNSKTQEPQTEEKEEEIERSDCIELEEGQKEETLNVSNVLEDENVDVLTENNEANINELMNEADNNLSSPKISKLQSKDKEDNIEISDSVLLDAKPEEKAPKVSNFLEGDQVEFLSENIHADNKTNIVTEDTLSISKTSELQIGNKEEIVEDDKVESFTKNNVTDITEVNNESEYTLSNSKQSEVLTEDQEEKIETSASPETEPKRSEENLTVTNVSESDKIESLTENFVVDPKEAKTDTDDTFSSSKTSELQTEDKEENIEISGSVELEADNLVQPNASCVQSENQEQTSGDEKMVPSEQLTEDLCNDKSIPSDQKNGTLIQEQNPSKCSDDTIQDKLIVEEGFRETVIETLDDDKILLSSNTEQQLNDDTAEHVDIPTATETLENDIRIVGSIEIEEESPVTDLSEITSNDLCTNEGECAISEKVKDDNQSQNEDATQSKEIEITSDVILESSVPGNIQELEVPENSVLTSDTKDEVSTSNPLKFEEESSEKDVDVRQLGSDQEEILSEDTQEQLDLSAHDEPATESTEEKEDTNEAKMAVSMIEECTVTKEPEVEEVSVQLMKDDKQSFDEPPSIEAEDISSVDENEKIDELLVKASSFESQNCDLSSSNIQEENKKQITIDVERNEKDVVVVEHDLNIASEVVQRSSEEDEEQCIGIPVSPNPAFMTEVLSSSDVESQNMAKEPEYHVLDSEIKVEDISETNLQSPNETNETTIKETRIEENATNQLTAGKDLTVTEEAIATTEKDVIEKSGKRLQSQSALHSTEPLKPSNKESKKSEDNSNVVAVVAAVLAIAIGMIIYHMFNKK